MPGLRPVPRAAVVGFVLFILLGFSLAWGQNDVLTQHNDNTRSGLNANETLLTPANVTVNTFGKLFTQGVDGIIVGQPLYASNILMNDGLVHNVVYVATQHNSVYAFDADRSWGNNASPLWSVSLDDGGTSDPISDYGCTGIGYSEIGIMGTPVIDPGKTTLYVVAKTLNNGVRNFSLHALDITTGNETLGGPVIITGTAPSGDGRGTFNPIFQMQRPALLLQSGDLYIGFGGNGCDQYAYNGWFFAYNSQTLQQEAAFLTTPNGTQGSIWQGGSGPAMDAQGNIYVATANGTFDGPSPSGQNDFGDTVLKLGWNGDVFGVLDYFTPYNQHQLNQYDLDLGSAGPLVLPDQPGNYPHELVQSGKQGTLYLINRDNEGQFNSSADNVIQEISGATVGEIMGVPSYWNSSVYVAGEGDYIKQFSLVNGALSQQPVSEATVFTSSASSTSISANGNNNGVLWAIRHGNPAVLFAFDPTNLANRLYASTQAQHARDATVPVTRFMAPTISNGKVYVGGTTALEAYGLLPVLQVKTGNNQTGIEESVLPVALSAVATDSYGFGTLAGVAVKCVDGGVGGKFEVGGVFYTSPIQLTTDATGTIAFSYKLPAKDRGLTITCSSLGYVSAVFNETSVVGPPAKMALISGQGQSAAPNTQLAAPIVVKVMDVNGFPVPGVTVNFTDNGAGGTFVANSIVTNSTGKVSAQYTTGTKAGKIVITASSTGLTNVNVSETCVAGPAVNIAITSGNNQSGAAGTKLPKALTVLVTDQYGNPVSGNSVNFDDGGAGGTFSYPNPVVTGSKGTASQFYTLPSSPGTITIKATATGITNPAVFTETAN